MDPQVKSPQTLPEHQEIKYSYAWASDVWARMRECYGRACNIFCVGFSITDRNMCRLIASGSSWWPQMRTLIHQIDRWNRQQLRVGTFLEYNTTWALSICESVLRIRGKMLQVNLYTLLTGRILDKTMKEQGFKGPPLPELHQGELFYDQNPRESEHS